MIENEFHWPHDLFNLLVETIPKLCRSKQDVLTFFQGAGVPESELAPFRAALEANPALVKKHLVTRNILTGLNARGDVGLGLRRSVLHRVVEFEEFSTCWENDQLKAKGLVADIRKRVATKDIVTRIVQERDAERDVGRRERLARQEGEARRRAERDSLRRQLADLRFELDVRKRGLNLEGVLNSMFALDGMLVREAFALHNADGVPIEQIDGVIALDGHEYLVEMKWWKDKLGPDPTSRHLVRVYGREGVRGIMIAASGYTPAAIEMCRTALAQKVIILLDLSEIQLMLEREKNLAEWLRDKASRVVLEKNPYLPPAL